MIDMTKVNAISPSRYINALNDTCFENFGNAKTAVTVWLIKWNMQINNKLGENKPFQNTVLTDI